MFRKERVVSAVAVAGAVFAVAVADAVFAVAVAGAVPICYSIQTVVVAVGEVVAVAEAVAVAVLFRSIGESV
jgi:hypothetical protein